MSYLLDDMHIFLFHRFFQRSFSTDLSYRPFPPSSLLLAITSTALSNEALQKLQDDLEHTVNTWNFLPNTSYKYLRSAYLSSGVKSVACPQ